MKNEKGVATIVLILSIVILFSIGVIVVFIGRNIINDVAVQTVETDMLAIKAKAKTNAEEVKAAIWSVEDKETEKKRIFSEEKNMIFIVNANNFDECIPEIIVQFQELDEDIIRLWGNQLSASLNENAIEIYMMNMVGLGNAKVDNLDNKHETDYLIVYDANEHKEIDVIYTPGIVYNNITYYTLSALQEANNIE